MRVKMKVIHLTILTFWINICYISCQNNYGFYGGVQFQPPNTYSASQQNSLNRGYNYGYPSGYGPYSSSYGPNSYLNSNYGNLQQPNLGAVLGDVSLAIMRSLGEMLMGAETNQFPYGQGIPLQPINREQNQFGYGVNAGVYAGTYGGQHAPGYQGVYGNRNNHIGSTYTGLSGWPVIPWFPPFIPPTSTISPTLSPTPSSTISTTSPSAIVTTVQDLPLASVVELPLLETLET